MAKKYGKSRRGSRKAGRKTRKAQRGGDEMNVGECTAKYMVYKRAGQNTSEFKKKYPQCHGKVSIHNA
jgi:hypothetical protein